jgi:hypothetical protein
MGRRELGPKSRSRRGGWLGLTLALGLGACSSTATTQIAALTAEGRANQLRAHAAHRDEALRMEGVVISAGLKNVDEVEGARSTAGTWSAREVTVRYPYLLAHDPSQGASAGELLCFFDPRDIDDVAALAPGDRVTVEGSFQEFSKGGARVVLTSCVLE